MLWDFTRCRQLRDPIYSHFISLKYSFPEQISMQFVDSIRYSIPKVLLATTLQPGRYPKFQAKPANVDW